MTNPSQEKPNWKKMYAILCGEISEALDALPLFPENMRTYEILEKAVLKTEEMYCAGDPLADDFAELS